MMGSMLIGPKHSFEELNGQKCVDVVLEDLDRTTSVKLPQASLAIDFGSELAHGGSVGVGELLIVSLDVIGRHDEGCVAETDKNADEGQVKGR